MRGSRCQPVLLEGKFGLALLGAELFSAATSATDFRPGVHGFPFGDRLLKGQEGRRRVGRIPAIDRRPFPGAPPDRSEAGRPRAAEAAAIASASSANDVRGCRTGDRPKLFIAWPCAGMENSRTSATTPMSLLHNYLPLIRRPLRRYTDTMAIALPDRPTAYLQPIEELTLRDQ